MNHFLAEAVPTAVMSVIAVTAFGTSHLVAFLAGIGWLRRRQREAYRRRQAAFDERMAVTVPMLAAPQGGDR